MRKLDDTVQALIDKKDEEMSKEYGFGVVIAALVSALNMIVNGEEDLDQPVSCCPHPKSLIYSNSGLMQIKECYSFFTPKQLYEVAKLNALVGTRLCKSIPLFCYDLST